MYQYCRWQGDKKTRALCLTVRLGQQESVAFLQTIQKIYSEEIGMCSNDINVEKKQCFG